MEQFVTKRHEVMLVTKPVVGKSWPVEN